MSSTRFFNGGREPSKRSVASEIMRIEIQKKGKLPTADRYRHILKKRLQEGKQNAIGKKIKLFELPGSKKSDRSISARAEQALKEVAMRKAAKEAKALRKMVIVTPRNFPNGLINAKGKIFDVAGNIVAEVNTKNGKIATMQGWGLGRYKPKSYFTNIAIQEAIDKHSPYFINLRKMQAMQAGATGGVWGPNTPATQEVINVYGGSSAGAPQPLNFYGEAAGGPRQNIGVTSWGARSDNVWGTYTDNAWGTSSDNVWGTNSTDVWGGIGGGNLWGVKGVTFWGTGSGKNYIKGITNRLAGFFGFSTKAGKETRNALLKNRSSRSSGPSTVTRSAPTSTRR